jgi:hypothetical protein
VEAGAALAALATARRAASDRDSAGGQEGQGAGDLIENAVEAPFVEHAITFVRTGSHNQAEIAARFEVTVHAVWIGHAAVSCSDQGQAVVLGKVCEVLDVQCRERQVVSKAACGNPQIATGSVIADDPPERLLRASPSSASSRLSRPTPTDRMPSAVSSANTITPIRSAHRHTSTIVISNQARIGELATPDCPGRGDVRLPSARAGS